MDDEKVLSFLGNDAIADESEKKKWIFFSVFTLAFVFGRPKKKREHRRGSSWALNPLLSLFFFLLRATRASRSPL